MATRNVWGDDETRQLISLWGDEQIQSELQDFSVRNNVVHGKLADAMKEHGFNRDAKQVKTKVKHLREVYRNHNPPLLHFCVRITYCYPKYVILHAYNGPNLWELGPEPI